MHGVSGNKIDRQRNGVYKYQIIKTLVVCPTKICEVYRGDNCNMKKNKYQTGVNRIIN